MKCLSVGFCIHESVQVCSSNVNAILANAHKGHASPLWLCFACLSKNWNFQVLVVTRKFWTEKRNWSLFGNSNKLSCWQILETFKMSHVTCVFIHVERRFLYDGLGVVGWRFTRNHGGRSGRHSRCHRCRHGTRRRGVHAGQLLGMKLLHWCHRLVHLNTHGNFGDKHKARKPQSWACDSIPTQICENQFVRWNKKTVKRKVLLFPTSTGGFTT